MSVNYALGLSAYEFKGKCGMKEIFDPEDNVEAGVARLVCLLKESKHTVVITGAGLSTAAGIPDFRGPKGVWTLEEKGLMPEVSINFETAKPTVSHMALVSLEAHGYINHLISQNVDGLHLRSGFPKNKLSELHGNMFIEDCDLCHGQFINIKTVPTMGLKYTGAPCTRSKTWGVCRGRLKDTILDWEDELPVGELNRSEEQCKKADLCLCLGTSLQIQPCGGMPMLTKKRGGKVAIISLQPTRHDKHADIKLHAYVDDVMKKVCEQLQIELPEWHVPTIILKSKHQDVARNSRFITVDEMYARTIDIPISKIHKLTSHNTLSQNSVPLNGKNIVRKKDIEESSQDNINDGILMTVDTQYASDEVSSCFNPEEKGVVSSNINLSDMQNNQSNSSKIEIVKKEPESITYILDDINGFKACLNNVKKNEVKVNKLVSKISSSKKKSKLKNKKPYNKN